MRRFSLAAVCFFFITLLLTITTAFADSETASSDEDSIETVIETVVERPLTRQAPVPLVSPVIHLDADGNIEETKITSLSDWNSQDGSNRPERKMLNIWGADHPLSVKYRERYLNGNNKKWLIEALERSVLYRPYIIEQLKEHNLPLLLQYLPIVESYYNVYAVSYAGATGIWQFMTNSMGKLLSKNTWYDERRDPWKSTDAALAKLSENYNYFGDWAIAIAAYNCGVGAMNKVVSKNKDKDFWYLAEKGLLKSQSAEYVPKLLAIADLVENAEYYGVPEIAEAARQIGEEPSDKFDYIKTNGMYSLEQIATVTDTDSSLLRMLNPALLRSCTPARMEYTVRLPQGTLTEERNQTFICDALKQLGVPDDAIIYTVQQGDTLWGISRKYRLSVQDICDANDIKEKAILRLKQKLIIPLFN